MQFGGIWDYFQANIIYNLLSLKLEFSGASQSQCMCFLGHVHSSKFESIIRLLIYLCLCCYWCPLGSTNSVFNVTIDIGVREVTCQFLNGPLTSATCTIQYGTDPTYVHLPNTDSSTGTNVDSLTVPLSTPLQADTLYYYVVSSMGVQMQGTFRTGTYMIMNQISKYLMLYFCGINNGIYTHDGM